MATDSPTPKEVFKLYRYSPSTVAAVIFSILFALTTGFHMYQLLRRRSWYFTTFIIGGLFETIGYIGRILAHSNMESVPIYSLQTILILLGPALFAASIYMVLGRFIVFVRAENMSMIPVKWMTKIFVLGDVIAFLGQAVGGGVMASGSLKALQNGAYITIGGLCVQLVFFSFFVFVVSNFHRRFASSPKAASLRPAPSIKGTVRTWETIIWALYFASFLILIRSAFRVIEFAMGNDGFLMKNEVFLYVFDATLMFLAMISLNVVHPSSFINAGPSYESEITISLSDA